MPSPLNKKRWGDMDITTSNANDDSFFSVDSAGVVNIMQINSSFDYIGQYLEASDCQGDTATENDDPNTQQARGVNSDVAVASRGRDRKLSLSRCSSSSSDALPISATNKETNANNSSFNCAASPNTSFDGCAPPDTTCIGVSDMIDSALTGFADAIFDSMSMRCGFNFDSSCNNWAKNVPGGVREI